MIRIPEPLSPELTFRWFCEYAVDHSGKFQTASAIAKAGLLLGADLDAVGTLVSIPESALKLLRLALTDEDQPLPLPPLVNPETQQPISPRVWGRFIQAILNDVEEAAA